MYSVSPIYLNKIKEPTRTVAIKVIIGDRILDNTEVQSLNVEYTFGNNGIPAIGGVTSSKLSLELLRIGNTPSYFTTQTIKPSVAIDDGIGNLMWVPLGTFYPNPDSIKRTDNKVSIECFDFIENYSNVKYESGLKYPTSVTNVVNELKNKYKVIFKDAVLPNVNVKVLPTGSIRDALMIIAELLTANCLVNRDNEIEFRSFNTVEFDLDTNNYIDFTLKSDSNIKISKLICKKGEDIFQYGDDTGATLEFENENISSNAELKVIYDRMFPFTYPSYDLKVQGMPHLECGDIIKLTDKKSVLRSIPIGVHKLSFNGGLISNISANVPSTNNSVGSTGNKSISQTANTALINSIKANEILAGNITADNLAANCITADKIDAKAITADKIKAVVIEAINASIEEATIDSAKIDVAEIASIVAKDLVVGNAQITDLEAEKIKTGNLIADVMKANAITAINLNASNATIDSAKIGNLSADKMSTNVINAINAYIGDATIDSAKIGNLDANKIITGDLSADRIKAGVISAINLSTDTATINSAKIGDLEADKITTGDISTDRMKANAINAVNATIGDAVISSAKIANLDASKITTGTLSADRIKAGSIDATKINSETISAIEVSAGELVANKIASGEIKVGNANIVDGTISGAKIVKASISEAQIAKATITDASIKSLNANKITTGKIDATKVNISSTSGKLSIADNTITIKDNQATPKTRVQIGLDARGNYGIYVLNASGQAIFDSEKGVLAPEGLNSNVVTTDKIKDEAIGSSKLNIDELFVGDNAFIKSLKAVEIDAANITTGKISSERLDINGLVSFDALDKTLQPIFDVQGDKTYINGGMIAANTIKADKIDLLSGLTVNGADGKPVFAIGKVDGEDGIGTVEINGWLHSSNYVKGKSGYSINTDGTAEINQATIRGTLDVLDAGVTNTGTAATDVRIWAGGSYENRASAKFRVNKNGDLYATNATLAGILYGEIESNNLHVKDSILTIKDKVKLSETSCSFNTDVTINNKVKYSTGNNSLELKDTNFMVNSAQASVSIDKSSGAYGGLNVIGCSQGHHVFRGSTASDKLGTLVIDAEGNQGQRGDFSFTRKNYAEKCKVDIDGDLTICEKINSTVQQIEMRSVKNSSWDGWGFYAN
ncbi:phage tail tip fiber protein [Clostridium paraputrificum]|uniref:phage tail tip fiber protein n=1 Tax=Clostridium paraputrificum TaxID=29363 RepID=UPI003F632950